MIMHMEYVCKQTLALVLRYFALQMLYLYETKKDTREKWTKTRL
jgi:hypothetical protein